jgi:hypothetical protein
MSSRRLDPERRAEMGQFFAPAPIARLMASMFDNRVSILRLLDAGAGVGALTAAWVAEVYGRAETSKAVFVTAYEVRSCQKQCELVGVPMYKVQVFATTHSEECIRAAHHAFEQEEYAFTLIRLAHERDGIHAKIFDREALDAALKTGLELR